MPEETLNEQSTISEGSTDYSEQESEKDYSVSSESEQESKETESEGKEQIEETAEQKATNDELPDDVEALKELVKKKADEAKEHQAAFTRKAQEAAELKKAQEQQESQEVVKLDTETQQRYNNEISKVETIRDNYLATIAAAYENGEQVFQYLDGQVYNLDARMVMTMTRDIEKRCLVDINGINSKYSQQKQTIDAKKTEIQKREIQKQFSDFEQASMDKLAKSENKVLYELFKTKGYDPKVLPDVFEMAETYLQTYLKGEAAKKAISSGIEADKSAMTTTVGKGGASSKPATIKTLDDIINYY